MIEMKRHQIECTSAQTTANNTILSGLAQVPQTTQKVIVNTNKDEANSLVEQQIDAPFDEHDQNVKQLSHPPSSKMKHCHLQKKLPQKDSHEIITAKNVDEKKKTQSIAQNVSSHAEYIIDDKHEAKGVSEVGSVVQYVVTIDETKKK